MIENANIRTIALIGNEKFNRLRDINWTLIGLGGVGGHAAEALVRAGCNKLKLIDFDKFENSNLNRQLGALKSTLGRKKVEVFKERFLEIDDDAKISAIDLRLTSENIKNLLEGSDYILDMCDDVNAKVAIINYAYENSIPLISAMGAGNRTDISSLKCTTLDKTRYCGLAKILRKRLKPQVMKKTCVLYYDSECKKKEGVIGTISYAPSYMGIRMASIAIESIIGKCR